MIPKNTICLWYDDAAEEAARFYAATFPDSTVGAVHRAPGDYPSGKEGDVLTVEFTVMGIPCIGLNGGPGILGDFVGVLSDALCLNPLHGLEIEIASGRQRRVLDQDARLRSQVAVLSRDVVLQEEVALITDLAPGEGNVLG